MNKPLNVFVSYSHKDEAMCQELLVHLSSMRREGLINDWYDRKLLAGDDWKGEIDGNLVNAGIILLLVSSDFIASDYCFEIEMMTAVNRHDKGQAVVIPIILRPCDWKKAPFGKIQGLPKDAVPITQWADRDSAYLNIVEGIRAKINQLSTVTKKQHPIKAAQVNKVQISLNPNKNTPKKRVNIPALIKPSQPAQVITPSNEDDDIDEQFNELIERLKKMERVFDPLSHLVSSTIYHDMRGNDFKPEYMDEDVRRDVRKYEAEGYIIEDEGFLSPNSEDPSVEEAMHSIKELVHFINECCPEVYDRFREDYKFPLDINSIRLWRSFFGVRVMT